VVIVATKVQQVSSRIAMAVRTLFVMIAESVEKIAMIVETRGGHWSMRRLCWETAPALPTPTLRAMQKCHARHIFLEHLSLLSLDQNSRFYGPAKFGRFDDFPKNVGNEYFKT
jgi:hypothetical protein